MGMRRFDCSRPLLADAGTVALVTMLVVLGCDGGRGPGDDSGAGDDAGRGDADVQERDGGGPGDADAGGDAPLDAALTDGSDGGEDGAIDGEVDAGAPFSADELSLVATEMAYTAERLCDVDGDGVEDNAIAELGEPGASNALMLWNALAEAALGDGYGPGLYLPVVDGDGESALFALSGDGTALGGLLRAPYESMDGCGEPTFVHRGPFVAGALLDVAAPGYPVLVSDAVAPGLAEISGRLADGTDGASLEAAECLVPTIGSLGGVVGPTQTRGVSLLEAMLGGGAALGVPGAPGLSPDVDLDGDGLERVLLGSDGRVERCIDGDDSVIEGRDCWADERMADGFALTRRVTYEETTFAGRIDGWMGHCDGEHARPSLFGESWNVDGYRQISAGRQHVCLRLDDGAVRCWGSNASGVLGLARGPYENTPVGDDERVCDVDAVDVGAPALGVMASWANSCAILTERRLRCWGDLGGEIIGDDETPASQGDFDIGAPVQQIVAGWNHYCALLSGGRVRCWGDWQYGVLGQGNSESIGADEVAFAPDVNVGGRVVALAGSIAHTCALLDDGAVRCWGEGSDGRLGYGNTETIGDDETPADAGDVDLGGPAVAIEAGPNHTCAIMEGGSVRCWGLGTNGALGYGDTENVGDDESPADAGDVNVGGPVVALSAGEHTCAVLEGGAVRCWGLGLFGKLGYGNTENVGDDETPADVGDVDLGGPASAVAAAGNFTCALMESGGVRCWGWGILGLGYGLGPLVDIGDDETPADVGDVPLDCP